MNPSDNKQYMTTQMDRLEVEGFQASVMHDQAKLGAFDATGEPAVVIDRVTTGFPGSQGLSLIETEIFETEKVSNGLIRSLRND